MLLEMTSIRRVVLLGAFAFGASTFIARPTVAETPSPALLVTVNGNGTHALQIIDPLNAKVVGNVPLVGGSGHSHEVAVSADGKFAYVTNTFDDADPTHNPGGVPAAFIAVVDLAAQKVLRHIDIGPGSFPHGIVCAGGKVYFTAEGYALVGRYDPAGNRIDWMFGTGHSGMHLILVTKEMNKIFTTSPDTNDVIVIEPWNHQDSRSNRVGAGQMTETLISAGKGPEGIAISPDGKEVWALSRSDGSASIIDVDTKKVKETLNLKTKQPIRLGFTPDGKRVLIADYDSGELLVLDAATRKEIKRIMGLNSGVHSLLIAPDGSHAYVSAGHLAKDTSGRVTAEANRTSNKIAVIDLKTLELTGQIVIGEDSDGMGWAETR
jgi:YVTN family beta-propeller protein